MQPLDGIWVQPVGGQVWQLDDVDVGRGVGRGVGDDDFVGFAVGFGVGGCVGIGAVGGEVG